MCSAKSNPNHPSTTRVLHIVPALFGSNGIILGGAERYVLELARHMSTFTPTSLLTFGERNSRDSEEQIAQLRIRTIGSPVQVRGQRFNPISAAIVSEVLKADIIHCHQQHILASSLAALIARASGKKVFVTDLGGGGWDISAYISTDRWFHGHLHISQYSRDVVHQKDKPWAHVIYGGVDTEKFSPGIMQSPRDTVVFVGRLLPHKGVNYLIEALPENMKLQIIGPKMDEAYYFDLQRLARNKQVFFHHDFGDADIVSAYRSALCVVLPSVYESMYGDRSHVPELLGQTLLEGMACGIPAICTDVASMPEAVEDGVTGFIVSPNQTQALRDKILWLRDHPAQAQQMGLAAREHVLRNFTWPEVVERCLRIYGISPSQ